MATPTTVRAALQHATAPPHALRGLTVLPPIAADHGCVVLLLLACGVHWAARRGGVLTAALAVAMRDADARAVELQPQGWHVRPPW